MKKSFFMFLILFVCGILSADVCIDIIHGSSVLMDLESYRGYADAQFVYQDVFWNVLYERIKLFIFLLMLCLTPFKRYLGIFFAGIFSFMWGFFMMSSIRILGLAGVVVGIASVLPHGILYGALLMVVLSERNLYTYHKNNQILIYVLNGVIMLLLLLTGCVLESLVSMHFIPWVIRLGMI